MECLLILKDIWGHVLTVSNKQIVITEAKTLTKTIFR